jgi:hypothetical protein
MDRSEFGHSRLVAGLKRFIIAASRPPSGFLLSFASFASFADKKSFRDYPERTP